MTSHIIKQNKTTNTYLKNELKEMFRIIIKSKEDNSKENAIKSIDSLIEQSEKKNLTKDLKKLREEVENDLSKSCKYVKEFYSKYFSQTKYKTTKKHSNTYTSTSKNYSKTKPAESYVKTNQVDNKHSKKVYYPKVCDGSTRKREFKEVEY